jgi:hypothetical protein
VLAENEGMLGLAGQLGFDRHRDPDAAGVVITTKRLRDAEEAAGPPNG